MVASRDSMAQSAEAELRQITDEMTSMAAGEEWHQVEVLAAKLENVVLRLPVAKRRTALLELRLTIEKLATEAQSARRDVADRLSTLRRGQNAAKAYEATHGSNLSLKEAALR